MHIYYYLLFLFSEGFLFNLTLSKVLICLMTFTLFMRVGGAVYSNNTGASDGWRTIRPRQIRPCHWTMMTGLMTTTARFGPIRGRFGRPSLFVNDVMSVKQNGVVLGTNRCEWVYRRRSVPLLRLCCCFTAIPRENNLDDQIRVSEASLSE